MEHGNGNGTLQQMDIYVSAFLTLQGVETRLMKQAGRVIFIFPNTPRVASLIEQYNSNPTNMRLLDYVQHLRRLRAKMVALRD